SSHKRYVFDNVPARATHKLTNKEYRPGGATPLYDAIGMGISKLNAQTTADDHVLVTIITDGEENCSEGYNLKMIKTLIEKLKKQNWTFTLIGAMAIDNHLEFKEDEAGTERMFACERRSRARYNERMAFDIPISVGSYFDEDETKSRKK
ncbi:MAG: VWA domain-containing protein, partial [Prevotella sp.]